VPAAVRSIPGYPAPFADLTLEQALLFDRFEVTRADWIARAGAGLREVPESHWKAGEAELEPETLEWPATWMTRAEARAFAELRGMRLPSAREWVHVAVGRSVLRYPYGSNPQVAWANTAELGLGRLAAAGTFESGRASASGCYDLLGNAAEWVEGWLPGPGDRREGALQEGGDLPPLASALGGSFRDLTRPTFRPYLEFNAVTLDPEHRGDHVGLRCAANAAEYLAARAAAWGSGPEARRRVSAVARAWAREVGRDPVERVVAPLAARAGAPEGLLWLLEGLR
jgi:formylglycine-generating enzyme required for sulfatase activity